MLALSPWHGLNLDSALCAINAPHGVRELHCNVPDWHELEQPRLSLPIVTRAGLPAARTLRLSATTGANLDDDSLMFCSDHFDIRINETLDLMNMIE